MARHTVRMHGVVVGYSELERADPGVRMVSGVFRPGLGYELVEPVFRLYADAVPAAGGAPDAALLARYHAARDRLGLELVDPQGNRVSTTSIHIGVAGPGELELQVLIRDEAYWLLRL